MATRHILSHTHKYLHIYTNLYLFLVFCFIVTCVATLSQSINIKLIIIKDTKHEGCKKKQFLPNHIPFTGNPCIFGLFCGMNSLKKYNIT